MKKINIILIVCVFYSMSALGQNKSELMQLTLPKSSVKLNESQSKELIHNGFDEKIVNRFSNHTYRKNNLLVYYLYSGESGPKFKRSLEFYQKLLVSLMSGKSELKSPVIDVKSSKIITVNGIRFLIIDYQDKGINYINFRSDYDKNLTYLNGFIEYKKPDEAEAQQYLQNFLESIHFKQ